MKDGKKLRRGYTTGSCAAAAAKAAAIMLLEEKNLPAVWLLTPGGVELTLTVREPVCGDGFASCGIVKDSGDDPDVTNGVTIYAKVQKTDAPGEIAIDGGEGIGRVTKPGLDQPVGSAAINSTPRKMITQELRAVAEDCGYTGGLHVLIYAPAGAALAQKTFNPRLGITGGLSVLGTTGIVEPMSDSAVVETIRAELHIRAATGHKTVLFTPGNYGAAFIRDTLHINPAAAVTTANFIGDAFDLAAQAGFTAALLVGHIGKLIKLAGGMCNTHSRWGDCRAEIFAAHAALCGADAETVAGVMDSAVTDDMLRLLNEKGLCEAVMESVMKKISLHLSRRCMGGMRVGAVAFSNVYGVLGKTEKADEILHIIQEER